MTIFEPEAPPFDPSIIDALLAEIEAAANVPFGDTSGLPPIDLAWVPVTDAPVEYVGSGEQPTWNDVNAHTDTQIDAQTNDLMTAAPVTGTQTARAIKVAAGETIKSLSGFINQATAATAQVETDLRAELDAMSANIGALQAINDGRMTELEAIVNLIVHEAIPSLQAQILRLRHDVPLYVEYAALANRQWTIDHIFDPLEQRINVTARTQKVYTDTAARAVTQHATHLVNTETLARIAAVAGVATAVKVATDFVDRCGEPMCQTMGPTTPLGKLFKALNLVADAALLAAILGMNEQQLADAVSAMVGKFATIVGDFEGFFAPGGETLAHVFASLVGSVL